MITKGTQYVLSLEDFQSVELLVKNTSFPLPNVLPQSSDY